MKPVHITIAALVLALATTACGAGDSTSPATAPDAAQLPPVDAIEVMITDIELGTGEVTVRGEKPTPCNDLGSTVGPVTDAIEIDIWAEPTDELCAQVVEPFEISFKLPDAAADTPVLVNGEEAGRIGG